MRDGERGFLVQAEQHLRPLIAEIIHQAVMQAAITGAGVERDIGDVERAQRIGHHVAAESGGVDAGRDRAIELGYVGIAAGFGANGFGFRHFWTPATRLRAMAAFEPDHEA